MSENYVERKVMEILRERNSSPSMVIDRETRLFEVGDSLDHVEVIMELEDEFEISIPDEDHDKIKTVGELIAYVEHRSAVTAATAAASPAPDLPLAGGDRDTTF